MNTEKHPLPDLPAEPSARPGVTRRRLVRIGLPVAVVLTAAAVLLHAGGGGTPAATATRTTSVLPIAAVGRAPGDPDPTVNGCLGGKPGIVPDGKYVDLDQIVLAAQKQAPLTPTGAAEFTATFIRWSMSPRAEGAGATARQVVGPKAVPSAADFGKPLPKIVRSRVDFSSGSFHLDAPEPGHATVFWSATAYWVEQGKAEQQQEIYGTTRLSAVDGSWRYEGGSADRNTLDAVSRISTPYTGGC